MHGIQCDEVEFQNCTSLVKYKYILVHTGIYWYDRGQTVPHYSAALAGGAAAQGAPHPPAGGAEGTACV